MHISTRLRGKLLGILSAATVLFVSPAAVLATSTLSNVQVTTYGFMLNSGSTYRVGGPTNIPNAAGTFKSGDLDDLDKYVETACVPMIMAIKNTSNSTKDIPVSPWHEYKGGTNIGFTDLEIITTTATASGIPGNITNLNQMKYTGSSIKTATSFPTSGGSTVTATVAGPYSGKSTGTSPATATEGFHHYNVVLKSVPKNTTVFIMTCGRLATDAMLFGGGNITAGIAMSGSNDADHVDVVTTSVLNLPTLTIEKDLVGVPTGTYTYTVTPAINGVSSTFSLAPGQMNIVIPNVLPSGPFKITEVGPAGYVFGTGTGTNCTFAGAIATASPTPGAIANNAKCVFTDKLEPVNGKLTVTKVVINDDGGTAVASDFTLTVNGNAVVSGVQNTFEPGEYQVSETNNPAYAASYSGDCDANGNVLITAGSVKNCTVTNNDRKTTLTVSVNVVNDNGGSKTVTDFPVTLDGNSVVPGTENTVSIGNHQVAAANDPSYVTTFSGACDASGNLTVAQGSSSECVVTLNDKPTTLKVTVNVVNDSNGIKTVSDFPIFVDGSPVTSGSSTELTPGFYTVTEPTTHGYSVAFSGACNSAGTATVLSNISNECIITNSDPDASLTIISQIINDNGQTLTETDFPATLDGNNVNYGEAIGVTAGQHRVSTPGNGFYVTTYGGDCSISGVITLAQGEHKTCIVKNDDAAPGLTVVTHVINDNGGTAVASDFVTILQAIGSPTQSLNGSEDGVLIENSIGFFGVGQAFLPSGGYNVSFFGDCFGVINPGETKVCTIVDDDIAPQVTIVTNVINDNGGTAVASDFTTHVTATNVSAQDFQGDAGGVTITFNAGSYSIDELPSSLSYNKSLDAGCSGTIAVGQAVTCTITNDDF
jgi:hypothetical protein